MASNDENEGSWGGRIAAAGNGLALGGGARLGAAMQAGSELLPADGSSTYNQALSENRDQLAKQRQAEPRLTKLLEILGSVPTSIALGGGAGAGGSIAARMAGGAKMGGALGAFSGLVGSDADIGSRRNFSDALSGGLQGSAVGAAAPLAAAGLRAGGSALASRVAGSSMVPGGIREAAMTLGRRLDGLPSVQDVMGKADAMHAERFPQRFPAAPAAGPEGAPAAAEAMTRPVKRPVVNPLADPGTPSNPYGVDLGLSTKRLWAPGPPPPGEAAGTNASPLRAAMQSLEEEPK